MTCASPNPWNVACPERDSVSARPRISLSRGSSVPGLRRGTRYRTGSYLPVVNRQRRTLPVSGSDRALPLTALHDERGVLRPVDELVHRVEAELDRHREIADLVLERLGADTGGEVVEDLAVLTARLVEADPALDRLGRALGRQPHLQPLAVDDVAALEVAADVRDVRGDRVVADADRRAVE